MHFVLQADSALQSGRGKQFARVLFFDHWNLKICRPVFFGIEATSVDIPGSPEHQIIQDINEIVFLEYLAIGKAEWRKGFLEYTLGLTNFPFIKPCGVLIEYVCKGLQ